MKSYLKKGVSFLAIALLLLLLLAGLIVFVITNKAAFFLLVFVFLYTVYSLVRRAGQALFTRSDK